ncbi:MAG: MBL fold metallo-hydrolase [Verrucomicrobiota bacterium]
MSQRGKSTNTYSGVFPKTGWFRRSWHFWRHRLIPQMFRAPHGETHHADPTPPPAGKIRLTWIGHASFLLQTPHHSILFDPNWAQWHGPVKRQRSPGLHLDTLPPVDLVAVSHAHLDHLHKPSLRQIESRHGIIIPKGNADILAELDLHPVTELAIWDEHQLDEHLTLIHTPSHHWGARFGHDTHRDYGGFLAQTPTHAIYHAGDSAYFDGFKTIGSRNNVDIALLPIGAYDAPSGRNVHLNPEQALQAFLDLGAHTLIPMHYATFPLGNEDFHEPEERLLAEASRLGLRDQIQILEPGKSITL